VAGDERLRPARGLAAGERIYSIAAKRTFVGYSRLLPGKSDLRRTGAVSGIVLNQAGKIVKTHFSALILTLISANGIAQPSLAQRDPVLDQEKAIAVKVEAHSHIKNFELQTKAPEIRIDAGVVLSSYDNGTGNVVHEEYWEKLPSPEQATFDQWATYTGDEPSGRQLFQDMFYRFFFVHELGHWMQDQVLGQRHDANAEMAKRNAETARWQYETVANRVSVAWWREQDPAYLAKLVGDFRKIQLKLPNPIPHGEDARAFFTREYDKLTEDPNAYGWFQLQMVILVYEEKPALSFQKAINKLPSENYGN
jgi:hypothetical protein